MPAGYVVGQAVVQEALTQANGTLTVGTVSALTPQYSTIGGTYTVSTVAVVGVILRTKKLTELDSVVAGEVSEDTGSIQGARIVGFGRALGTVVGTLGTISPASNNIVAELFTVGTTASGGVLPSEAVADGVAVVGSVVVTETGR